MDAIHRNHNSKQFRNGLPSSCVFYSQAKQTSNANIIPKTKSFHLYSTNRTNHSRYDNHSCETKEQTRLSNLQTPRTKSRRISSSQGPQARHNNQPHASTKAAHPRRPSHTNIQSQSISAKQVLVDTQHTNTIIH